MRTKTKRGLALLAMTTALVMLGGLGIFTVGASGYESAESKIDGIGFYHKASVTTANEVYVNTTSLPSFPTDWTGVEYVALLVNNPTAAGWAFNINIYDSVGGVSFLHGGEPTDPAGTGIVDVYNTSFEKIGTANAGYTAVFTVASTAQYLLFSKSVLGISELALDKISQLRFAFDMNAYNTGISMEIGKMMFFTEAPNATFSNGTTILDPAAMSDAEMQTAYILTNASGPFTDYMTVKRVSLPVEVPQIELDKADSYYEGIRFEVLSKGTSAYQVWMPGAVKDLSAAKYIVFDVSNTTDATVPLLMLGGQIGVGTTTGFTGTEFITLTHDGVQGTGTIQYSNLWIPAKFAGKAIVALSQFAGTFDWANTDLMIINIDSVNNPSYAFDLAKISYVETEISDFTAAAATDYKTYYDPAAEADDNALIEAMNFINCKFGESITVKRTEAKITKPAAPEEPEPEEPIVLDEESSYMEGIRIKALLQGSFQVYMYGQTKDLSAAKHFAFKVSNPLDKEVPVLLAGAVLTTGNTTGFSGTSFVTLTKDGVQGTGRIEYSNLWIPAKFAGTVIVSADQIAGYDSLDWSKIDLFLMSIDAITNPGYSIDISGIFFIESEASDFTTLTADDYKVFFDPVSFEDDDTLLENMAFVFGNRDTHIKILRVDGELKTSDETEPGDKDGDKDGDKGGCKSSAGGIFSLIALAGVALIKKKIR